MEKIIVAVFTSFLCSSFNEEIPEQEVVKGEEKESVLDSSFLIQDASGVFGPYDKRPSKILMAEFKEEKNI